MLNPTQFVRNFVPTEFLIITEVGLSMTGRHLPLS